MDHNHITSFGHLTERHNSNCIIDILNDYQDKRKEAEARTKFNELFALVSQTAKRKNRLMMELEN